MIRKLYSTIVLCFFVTVFNLFTTNAQTDNKIKSLPDLELKLHNNETVNLKELKGKVVLLDFWFRGCFPCAQAIPGLIELQEEFKDGLVIIGINDLDSQEDVEDYLAYKKANYLSAYKTDNNISKIFNIEVYPTTILYDREGNLVKMDAGYTEGGMKSLRKAIIKALK